MSEPAAPSQTIATLIQSKRESFAQVAGVYLSPDRLVKLAQVIVSRNPRIAECTPLSVLDCLMTCARLGLEPNQPGGVWLVPFKNKVRNPASGVWQSVMTLTTIVDYRGMLDIARRGGQIKAVHAGLRHEHDLWEYAIDTAAVTMVKLRHEIAKDGNRGEVVGAFFVARLDSGECQATYLTKTEIESYRGRSRNADGDDSPWHKDWAAMAIKTVVRRGVNLLPKTPEMQALREVLANEDIDVLPAEPAAPPALPRRRSEASISPSAEPPDTERAPAVGVTLHDAKKHKDGTANVTDHLGVLYRVLDTSLVSFVMEAAEHHDRVVLSLERQGDDIVILELARVGADG